MSLMSWEGGVGNTMSPDLNSGKHKFSLVDALPDAFHQVSTFYKITVNGDKTYSKSFW